MKRAMEIRRNRKHIFREKKDEGRATNLIIRRLEVNFNKAVQYIVSETEVFYIFLTNIRV